MMKSIFEDLLAKEIKKQEILSETTDILTATDGSGDIIFVNHDTGDELIFEFVEVKLALEKHLRDVVDGVRRTLNSMEDN